PIQVLANMDGASGEVRVNPESGWTASKSALPFQMAQAGEQTELDFIVTPPAGQASSRVSASASVGGTPVDRGMQVISYPHIPTQVLFPQSAVRMESFVVESLAKKCGYIMGAGDQVPLAIEQLGCAVTLLTPESLLSRDLSEFDAIVLGVRAYNVRADVIANQDRLMAYVRGGGAVIVQYNVLDTGFLGRRQTGGLSRIGPYPLTVGKDRVTVEESPVTFLKPEHPLLNKPNKITARDFEGWVQERGLYFPSRFDGHYEAVIATNDPGEKPLPGGLLYTRYGKGVFIYTSYAWFRQLPAGVPGAYRIFANFLSAGKVVQQ
ncbi:MAG: LmbE family protein, partial [Bryobacteraceae bacterium]